MRNLTKLVSTCRAGAHARTREGSGANYWEEREQAKEAALKMAAKLTARERGYLVRSVKNALSDEVRHDQTLQRKFERSFLSLDAPDNEDRVREYSFGNRELNHMVRELDRPYWEQVHERRFAAALWKLRVHPALCRTLRAIRTHRRRERIIAALGITKETYRQRLAELMRVFGVD